VACVARNVASAGHQSVHLFGSFPLELRDDVGVCVHGERDLRVPDLGAANRWAPSQENRCRVHSIGTFPEDSIG